MDYTQLRESVGTNPSLTFGCSPPDEIVGPIKPQSVQYGVTNTTMFEYGSSALFMNFNKYRRDLPPWQHVREIVVANERNGNKYYATLRDIEHCSVQITGDLKTITLAAKTIVGGLEQLSIIDRSKMGDGYQGEKL